MFRFFVVPLSSKSNTIDMANHKAPDFSNVPTWILKIWRHSFIGDSTTIPFSREMDAEWQKRLKRAQAV